MLHDWHHLSGWIDIPGGYWPQAALGLFWLPLSLFGVVSLVRLFRRRGQKLAKEKRCDACGREIQPEWMRCPHCGAALKEHCPRCSVVLSVGWKTCPACGAERP